ncbi:MAG TPA: hypothetical protein VF363_09905 [Candidatus Eisenbacteria bacterium]
MLSHASLGAAATAVEPPPAGNGGYLRRYRAARPRPRRHGPIALALLGVTLLLFARVWQVTTAHALSKEHDELRRDVRSLENRIRLSSELSVQSALHDGLDYKALAKEGFESPDPSRIVDIDLAQPLPSVKRHDGAVAALSARVGRIVRGIFPARAARGDEARLETVSAEASR